MKTQSAILLASLLMGTNAFTQQSPSMSAPEVGPQYFAGYTHVQETAGQADTSKAPITDAPTREQKTGKKLVKTERREVLVFDKNQLVHTIKNPFGNKAAISFTLPPSQTGDNTTSTVVAWACWVGVKDAANQAWQQNSEAVAKLPKDAASPYTTPLGAFAVGAVPDLVIPTTGEDVYFALTNEANKKQFLEGQRFRLIDQGKGRAGYKKFTDPTLCQGTYYVCLANDNVLIPIAVNIKVVAIVETKYFEN